MIRKLIKVSAEATLYFTVGILLCAWHYSTTGPIDTFARRWDGSCTGWTRDLVVLNVLGNLLLWWAYSAISVVVLRLHPIIHQIRESKLTIYLTGAFIFTCGATHLIDAYAAFNPVYEFASWFLLITAAISDVSVFFVAAGLIRVFAQIEAARARLSRF